MPYTADSPSSLIDEKGRTIWNEDRYHICYDDGHLVYWFGVESNPKELAFYAQDFKAVTHDGVAVDLPMQNRKKLFDEIAAELPKITSQELVWVDLEAPRR